MIRSGKNIRRTADILQCAVFFLLIHSRYALGYRAEELIRYGLRCGGELVYIIRLAEYLDLAADIDLRQQRVVSADGGNLLIILHIFLIFQ